ncbi:unnamed protein product [Nezara viridula]|uniref:Uncharacterized protein n=1 Tax=Nezara viridula TaxID=85310 RepID=A0A9P0EED6_NEZVI|nr:unnamed protein product [Nezara viridula]
MFPDYDRFSLIVVDGYLQGDEALAGNPGRLYGFFQGQRRGRGNYARIKGLLDKQWDK